MNRLDPPRQALAVSLAGLAGFVDASGFMANGGYFISFMSGNTTRLAVDIASAPGRALVPAGLIAGFVLGVMLGTLAAGRAGAQRKAAVLALVAGLLALGGGLSHGGAPVAAQGLMVMAMGALNATFQRDGEVTVGLTYMTGALVKTGQGLAARLAGRQGPAWGAQALLWGGLLAGGIAGAAAYGRLGLDVQAVSAAWAGLMALAGWRIAAAGG